MQGLGNLAAACGVTPKTILDWVKSGVLLPPESSEFIAGMRGRQAFYPDENLKRVEVIAWFRNYFKKKSRPGLRH